MLADGRPARTGASRQQSASRMSGSAAFQRAKGLLAAWFDLTPDEAENLLLTWACENKMSACALATALVTDIHEGRPSGCSPAVVRYLETRLPEAAAVSDRTSARTRKHSAEAGTGWAWMRKNSSVDLSRGTGLLQLIWSEFLSSGRVRRPSR